MEATEKEQVGQYVSGVAYPATKQEIIDYAQNRGASSDILETLDMLDNQKYDSMDDVMEMMNMNEMAEQ